MRGSFGIVAVASASAASAAGVPHGLDLPAGTLSAAVSVISRLTGASIGLSDAALGGIAVPSLSGRFTARQALGRLLRGRGLRVVAIDEATFRIELTSRGATRAKPALPTVTGGDIVVTAGRRRVGLRDYPGGVVTADLSTLPAAAALEGSEGLVARSPILASTHLGPGRDKIFIRGIADSSFSGPTQSTVGEYLGEVRLNYSAPDPDLALYDMATVEILEGPQGTLYGAGTIGGILRLVPNAPDLTHASGTLSLGVGAVQHGGPGGDGAAVVNLPVATGRLAVRAVAYASSASGWIDDPARGLSDVNRTTTRGGRLTLRFAPAAGWTIDVGGLRQDVTSRDAQYAERSLPPLTRSSVVAQPFDNDYSLGSVVVRHDDGATAFVSATSAVVHDIGTVFDASPTPARPMRFVEDDAILLLGNETRLSRSNAGGTGWVIGTQLLRSRSRIERSLGPPGGEPAIAGTVNVVDEAALYGEATVAPATGLLVTAGGRLAYDRILGRVVGASSEQPGTRRHSVSALPSVGASYRIGDTASVYARYQVGYRPGGLAVRSGGATRFEADEVATAEVGLRIGRASGPIDATVAISAARWSDIQADLVDEAGLPFTANIGDGRVETLEARAAWRPTPTLTVDVSGTATRSRLRHPTAEFSGQRDASLPNIPKIAARAEVRYAVAVLSHRPVMRASASYVGRSKLGVGDGLGLPQGRVLDVGAGIALPLGRTTLSLDATNLADARGNRFSLGDPFHVRSGDQITPLRPRTIRLGAAIAF